MQLNATASYSLWSKSVLIGLRAIGGAGKRALHLWLLMFLAIGMPTSNNFAKCAMKTVVGSYHGW